MCVAPGWRCNAQCENLSEAHIAEDTVVQFSSGTSPIDCKSSYDASFEKELLSQMGQDLSNRGGGSNDTWKADGGISSSTTKFGPRALANPVMQPGWEEMQQLGMKLKLSMSGSFLRLGGRPRNGAKASLRGEGELADHNTSPSSMKLKRSSSQQRRSPGSSQSMKDFLTNRPSDEFAGVDVEEFPGASEQKTDSQSLKRSASVGDSRDTKASLVSKFGLTSSLSKRHIFHIDPELGLPQVRVELTPKNGEEVHFYQDETRQPETVYWNKSFSKGSLPVRTRSSLSMSSSGVTSRFSAAMNSAFSGPITPWDSEAVAARGSGINTPKTSSSNHNSILADEVVASISQVAPVIARQMETGSRGHADEGGSSDSDLEVGQSEWQP